MTALFLIITTLLWFGRVLQFFIFARSILSWFPAKHGWFYKVKVFVYNFTEPVVGPVRKLLAKSPLGGSGMMMDFSALFAMLIIELVCQVLDQMLFSL